MQKIAPALFIRDGNGDVKSTISFDKESYASGETVTYTISCANAYYDKAAFNDQAIMVVGGVSIAFNVEADSNDSTKFVGSFVMPDVEGDGDVTFYAAPFSIYNNNAESTEKKTLTYNVCDGIVAIAPSSFVSGSYLYSITLYRSKSIMLTKAALKIGTESYDLSVSNLQWNNDFVTLSLGSKTASDDVVITIEGKEVTSHSLNIVGEEFITYNTTPSSHYLEGETVDFRFTSKSGYNVTYTIDGAENAATYSQSSYISFVMPANDVTITFTGTEYGKITVATNTNVTSSSIYVDGQYGNKVEATSAAPGSTFYVLAEATSGYKLGKAYIEGDEENKVSVSDIYFGYDSSTYTSIYKSGYTFTMPKDGSSANIIIEVGQAGTITLTADAEHYSGCKVGSSSSLSGATKSLTDFAPGDEFYLFPTVLSGFGLTGASVSDGTNSTEVQAGTASEYDYSTYSYVTYSYVKCTMPENGVANVTFTFGNMYSVTIDNESGISSQVRFSFANSTTSYAAGNKVTVNISETFGYSLSKLECKGASSETTAELEIKADSYGNKYVEFDMPSENVTLIATVDQSAKTNVKFEYVNDSTSTVSSVTIRSVRGGESLSNYSVAAEGTGNATYDVVVGDTISVSVSDSNAYDYSTYSLNFVVTVEISYSDGTETVTKNAVFNYGNYTVDGIEVTSNLAGVKVTIADKTEAA